MLQIYKIITETVFYLVNIINFDVNRQFMRHIAPRQGQPGT